MSRTVRLALLALVLGGLTSFVVLFPVRFFVNTVAHGGFW